jgi:hypothetical protein
MLSGRKRTGKCDYCGESFELSRRGQLYCRPSHRQRAFERRRIAEIKQPGESAFRLLTGDLKTLQRQRERFMYRSVLVSGMLGKHWRNPAYERTVSKVRKALSELAPEVLEQTLTSTSVELRESSKLYRKLAAKHHPDHGGDSSTMTALNELWQAVQADLKRTRR